ncbi:MAG: DUF3854 domain-containing protein [Candidatus Nealsonbacteria bacterium]|nr:DUF3854 domain-containing protein [Candidatus Nealsonbacteria bacterium]
MKILPHHQENLRRSGLSDATIRASGIYSETDHQKLASLLNRKRYSRKNGPGLVFPYFDQAGAIVLCRIKPDRPPQNANGKAAKYLAPSGSPVRVYIPQSVNGDLAKVERPLLLTEGEKKSLCATQNGFLCVALSGVDCWHARKSSALLPDLEQMRWKGREVYLAFDSDAVENENVRDNERLLAATLGNYGATVKIVRLPAGPGGAKVGLDDYVVAEGADSLRKLIDQAEEPEPPDPDSLKQPAAEMLPEEEAKHLLDATKKDGHPRLRCWRETWWKWTKGRYVELRESDVRAHLVDFLNRRYFKVGRSALSNTLMQLESQALLPSTIEAPSWLATTPGSDWRPAELLICRNLIVHLPSLFGGDKYSVPPTPALFATAALDCDFIGTGTPKPERWLRFLSELWPDDPEAIQSLQLWAGYLLTPDTSQDKLLALIGPKRGGKTTIAKVLAALVGQDNVASPTLGTFASQFGLWGLIGKTLAVIGDARLSGRVDAHTIVERLLSITGRDAIDLDRKFLRPVTTTLPTRIMLVSNELPRLPDASGTIVSRMIVLRLTQSWYGCEDKLLLPALMNELPGVLWWAIDGWRKLQERGGLLQPESGAESIQQLDELASPVGTFVRDCCRVGPEYSETRRDLFDAYVEWCKAGGRTHVLDSAQFGRDLRAILPALRDSQPRVDGERARTYNGVGLKPSWE